jgi:hypothetical protein
MAGRRASPHTNLWGRTEPEADDMLTYELWLAVMNYFQPFASQAAPGSTASAVDPLDAASKAPGQLRSVRASRAAREADPERLSRPVTVS